MDIDKDIKLEVGWNRLNLTYVGVWPEPTISEDRSSKYKCVLSIIIIVAFVSAPQSANLFLLNGNLELITENLSLANMPATLGAMKIFFTWYHRKDLKVLVKSFYNDWHGIKTEEERQTMLNTAKTSRYISTWCTLLGQAMIIVYLSLRTVAIATCDRNQTEQYRLVIYPGYFPYNVRPSLILVLTNLGQVCATFCATCSYTGVDAFIAMLILHTCGQFTNLRRRLERLMDKKNDTKTVDHIQKELVWIVKRHEHLNWMAKEIDNSFNLLMLIQMVFCTIEMCFQGFLFFNVMLQSGDGFLNFTFLFFILFVLYIVVHIYLYCYVGEMLLIQSSGMSNSAYNANWFNATPQKTRCLLLIMNRCSRPLCLNAGKFGIFSMQLFSACQMTNKLQLKLLHHGKDRYTSVR